MQMLRYFKTASQLSPLNPFVYQAWAVTLVGIAEYEAARQVFQSGAAACPR